jgi:hypothetical protein
MDYEEDVPQYYRNSICYGVPYEGPPDRIRTQRCFLVRIPPSRPRPPFVPTLHQVPLPAAQHPLPLRRLIPMRTRIVCVRRIPYVLATGAEVTVQALEHPLDANSVPLRSRHQTLDFLPCVRFCLQNLNIFGNRRQTRVRAQVHASDHFEFATYAVACSLVRGYRP